MGLIERAEPDERRWTLRRSHPMTTSFDGPRLALGEVVEVIPASQLRGAVERCAEADRLLRAAYADVHPEDVPVGVLNWLNPTRPGGQ